MTDTDNRQTVGKRGEAIAAEYLQARGYAILARNVRFRHGELDIVARHGDTLVFVEVKTGTGDAFGEPQTWVDAAKQRRLGRLAAAYLGTHHLDDVACRFDVIAVCLSGSEPVVRHITDAFWLQP